MPNRRQILNFKPYCFVNTYPRGSGPSGIFHVSTLYMAAYLIQNEWIPKNSTIQSKRLVTPTEMKKSFAKEGILPNREAQDENHITHIHTEWIEKISNTGKSWRISKRLLDLVKKNDMKHLQEMLRLQIELLQEDVRQSRNIRKFLKFSKNA